MRKKLLGSCEALSALALFAIMGLTFFDVLGRKFLHNSIPGALELTELLMVVVIFAGLPLVSEREEHVEFDALDAHTPPLLRTIQFNIVQVICAALLIGVGVLMWQVGEDFSHNGETTAQLGILKAPFIYGMSVMCVITGIVHLLKLGNEPEEHVEGQGAV